MEDSVFTSIIKGQIPCYKIYEDDKTLAFLDIHPIAPGMSLVITKNQVAHLEDLTDDDYHALWATVKKVALKMRQAFPESLKIAIQVEGLDVPHVHVKVFPLHSVKDFRREPDTTKENNKEELQTMAQKLEITS